MADPSRRVWRAAPSTLAVVIVFLVLACLCVPALAYLIYTSKGEPLIPIILSALTVVALLYAWRFGLHPSLRADDSGVTIKNPFRKQSYEWDDITLVAPGENGIVLGSADHRTEAWCVQKSNHAAKHGRETRADRIARSLLDRLEAFDPPVEDAETKLRVRRARWDDEDILVNLERAASEHSLAHIFPPDDYPYPVRAVRQRWQNVLRDRFSNVRILEHDGEPVGFVSYTDTAIKHLGVSPRHARRGYGTALLDYACEDIFADLKPTAELWVLEDNKAARNFYLDNGWDETEERQDCEFDPYPVEIKMTRRNPSKPRRSR